MKRPESNYLAWLAKADEDFLDIENNICAARVPWSAVCFHAQQAAEKLLKAILVFHGRAPARTHDLVALLTECVSINDSLRELEADCLRLTYHGTMARYPSDLSDPNEVEGRAMVEIARRVETAVRRMLPAPPAI